MLNNVFDFPKPVTELKFSVHQPNALYDIAMNIRSTMQEAKVIGHDIVVLCIGTDRSTGDSLGPLTGTKLKTMNLYPYVYGTLDEPVHATNLPSMVSFIQSSFAKPFIIAVDACLGKLENVGFVSLGQGPVKPGAAVNKDLPAVGNAYITGVVNVGGFMEHLVLQSTRLNLVMRMSDTIAHGLSFALNKMQRIEKT